MACLSIINDHPDTRTIRIVLEAAIKSFNRGLSYFDEQGGNPEGPGYWYYALEYIALAIESLQSATGSDQGLLSLTGLERSGDYLMHITSNSYFPLGHGDSAGGGAGPHPALHWLSKVYPNKKNHLAWHARPGVLKANRSATSFYLLNFYQGKGNIDSVLALPKSAYFSSSEIATFRSEWVSKNATFIAIKGGNNQNSHTHLDLGTFVYQSIGEKWFEDLGKGNYSLPGYFVNRDNYYSRAWNYYRLKAEGQNTIVFNPGEAPGQGIKATAKFLEYDPAKKHAVVDLSLAYNKYAKLVHRGAALLDDGKTLLLKDHISQIQSKPATSDYFFSAHTKVLNAQYYGASKKAIVLTADSGAKLLVFTKGDGSHPTEFLSAPDGSPLHKAEPLTNNPEYRPYWQGSSEALSSGISQNPNSSYRKIVIKSSSSNWLINTVVMVPFQVGQPVMMPTITDLRFSTYEPQKW